MRMAHARGGNGGPAETGLNESGSLSDGLLLGQGRAIEAAGLVEAAESLWLDEVRRGYSIKHIARGAWLGRRRVQQGVARARLREQTSRIGDGRIREVLHEQERTLIAYPGWTVTKDRLPELVPLFPITAFTPQSTCPHRGPVRPGSVFCCMVCSRSGIDGHPALKRDPKTDPRPDPKLRPGPVTCAQTQGRCETRKQRRRREHATRQATLAAQPERKHPASSPAPSAASSSTS
jgi:hypothetical protein